MKLEKYLLRGFKDKKDPQAVENIVVPLNAIFKKAIVLPDGIYMFYLITELEILDTRVDTYAILRGGQSIPNNAEIVDIIDIFSEENEQTAVIIYPIIKINN